MNDTDNKTAFPRPTKRMKQYAVQGPELKTVLGNARSMAKNLNHPQIGVDLVFAALMNSSSKQAVALKKLLVEINPLATQAQMLAHLTIPDRKEEGRQGALTLSVELSVSLNVAKQICEDVCKEGEVSLAHLLVGIIEQGDNAIARLLSGFDIPKEALLGFAIKESVNVALETRESMTREMAEREKVKDLIVQAKFADAHALALLFGFSWRSFRIHVRP